MAEPDDKPSAARELTDSSLKAERTKADHALDETQVRAEKTAEKVLDRARDQADQTLETARAQATTRLEDAGASEAIHAAVKAVQAREDTALEATRQAAEVLLEAERAHRQRATEALLQAHREQTDQHLLVERALVDERLAEILAELAEAVRFRDKFLEVAAHELKTPLTPLALRVQSLAKEAARQPESPFAHQVRGYTETAMRQLRRLSTLVSELLDVSHMISGPLELVLEPVDLGAVVRKVTTLQEPRAKVAGCELLVEAPSAFGRWDELLLGQLITHLLENAIKYGAGKPIQVRVEPAAEQVRLTIKDGGIGIAPWDLERIFGRFERAVSESNYGGLGLGLYTCRTIAEAMEGTITVQSEPGKGAAFTLELPRAGPGASPHPGTLSPSLPRAP